MKNDDFTREALEKLVEEFVALVVEADDLFGGAPIRTVNKLITRHVAVGLEIMSRGEAGTTAMISLMAHENIAVRGAAAARCLLGSVDREKAINVLADICDLRMGDVSMNAALALLMVDEFEMKTGPKRPK